MREAALFELDSAPQLDVDTVVNTVIHSFIHSCILFYKRHDKTQANKQCTNRNIQTIYKNLSVWHCLIN